tara:strand:+ start:889 stop:1050 length:162 start_codon:yes stop_codon:yes gene_type:complete
MKKRSTLLIVIFVVLGVGIWLYRSSIEGDIEDTADYSEDKTEEIMRAIGYVQQ